MVSIKTGSKHNTSSINIKRISLENILEIMKILLLGKNGQVGFELQSALQVLGELVSLDRNFDQDVNLCGDVTNFKAIEHAITTSKPNLVVNATAYTAVDKAETECEKADLVNHQAVKKIAELCKQQDILLIHYSTDYVFNGDGDRAWQEDDLSQSVNIYGKSKRDGEIALEESGVKFINLRTSWVYGVSGNNFIKTMLKLAETKDELSIICDQIGAPTSARLIANTTVQVVRQYFLKNGEQQQKLHGHYHLAASGYTSWYNYAQYIFLITENLGQKLKIKNVYPIPTSAYPTMAKRPLNSRLNTIKLQNMFQIELPHWQHGVAQVLQEIIE